MDGTVQICRGFAVAQWRTLDARLINRDGTNSDDQEAWRCAIEVFERRIRERFLSCIEALGAADSRLDTSTPAEAPACYVVGRWFFFKNAVYRGSPCKLFSRGSTFVEIKPVSCWA
jgi:hypothetical protein